MTRDLRPVGPVEAIDRALLLVRRAGWRAALRAWGGGLLVLGAMLIAFWVERIEGVRSLRLAIGALLVAAWLGRSLIASAVARDFSRALWEHVPIPPEAGRPADVIRTASVVAMGLWVWLWVLVGASLLGALGVILVLPLFALRGLVAPSWLARARCTTDAGFRAVWRAAADNDGKRAANLVVELLMLFASVALFIDVYALIAVLMLLMRSFLGLDVAAVDQFLSFDNTFVLLGVAGVALVLIEPVRAALSAVAFVDARVRQEGLDLRAAVDEAIATSTARRGTGSSSGSESAAVAALVLIAVLGATATAAAQDWPMSRPGDGPVQLVPLPPQIPSPPPAPPEEDLFAQDPPPNVAPGQWVAPEDQQVRDGVRQILERDEFREFSDDRGASVREMLRRVLEWLTKDRDVEAEAPRVAVPTIPMPPPQIFLVFGALLLLSVLAYLIATRRRDVEAAKAPVGPGAAVDDPRDRPPEGHLADAAALAAQGHYRAALRALYLATLVALDRRRMISFDPTLTNWQYLRQMPRGEPRQLFSEFTRLFDFKWYGEEETRREDYERGRVIAERVCAPQPGDEPRAEDGGAQGDGPRPSVPDVPAGVPDREEP